MSIRDKVNFGHQSDCNLGVDADPCQKVARRGALTSHAAATAAAEAGNVLPWGTAAALCHKYFITSITKHLTFMNLIRKMPSSPLLHFDAAGQEQEQDEEYREQAAAARLSRVPNNQHSTGRAIAFFVAALFPRTSVSR